MNNEWKKFLIDRGAQIDADGHINFNNEIKPEAAWICPIIGIGSIEFTGADTAEFLQGQVTCDINLLSDTKSSIGAYCNAKGRAISVFRVFRFAQSFYWLMSEDLTPAVIKRLQMYVLRCDVKINAQSDQWCLMGISPIPPELPIDPTKILTSPAELDQFKSTKDIAMFRPSQYSDRMLLWGKPEAVMAIWDDLSESQHYVPLSPLKWQHANILDGIPEINSETCERFIPQMINLDALQGISFKKGCYTGQEIVARMHSLGKLKKRMFLATTESNNAYPPNTPIYDLNDTVNQSVGNIVTTACSNAKGQDLLAVLQLANADSNQLRIGNIEGEKLKIRDLPYQV